ncbi:SusC/RagA family TonB-linked outer membrane protein, partial [bacterium]|nr:SusC/RagA family TonB-linked outer membrane protein [bacterium]
MESQSEFYFLYSPKLIDVERTVTVAVENQPISEILNEIFGDDVKYAVYDRQIILTPADDSGLLEQIQGRSVTGKVLDTDGSPLPGVSVVVKGTTKGTSTDTGGLFQIEVPAEGGFLIFTFIGMKRQELEIGNQSVFNVTMEEGDLELDEVVVIGYGVQKKRDLTGVVSAIASDEISTLPVTGVQQALQGQASGVMITQNHGAPGAGIQVRIRGVGTIGDSDPLYVIDGVPTKEGINNLNTSDIESISILKDAAASAIYGTRSSNGVILITTKRGKAGVTDVVFNSQYGIQKISNKLDLLNAQQYADICDEALVNAGLSKVWNGSVSGTGTDWQDVVFQNATYQKYDLTVSKGDNNTQFLLGAGYLGQEGAVRFSGLERYNLRFNIDSRVNDNFHVGANLNLARTNEDMIDVEINGVVRSALFQPPTVDVYNPDGSYAGPGANEGDAQNPLGMADRSDKSSQNNLAFGNIFGEYSILPNLKFRSSLGVNIYSTLTRDFDPTFSEGNANRNVNSLLQTSINYSDIIWENTLNYKPQIGEFVKLDILAGNTVETSKNQVMSGYREGFAGNMDFLQYLDGGSFNDKTRGNLYE